MSLTNTTTPPCASCGHSVSAIARFCEICGSKIHPPDLDVAPAPITFDAVDFAVKMWDRLPLVSEQCREAKRSARSLAALFAQRSEIEAEYAQSLRKLLQSFQCNLSFSSSVGIGIESVTQSWAKHAAAHATFSKLLIAQCNDPLVVLRDSLRKRREELTDHFELQLRLRNEAQSKYESVSRDHRRALADEEAAKVKLRCESNLKNSEKLASAELEVHRVSTELYSSHANLKSQADKLVQTVSQALQQFGQLDVDGSNRIAAVLRASHRLELDRLHASISGISTIGVALRSIDAVHDAAIFVAKHTTSAPCPWFPGAALKKPAVSVNESIDSMLAIPALPPSSPSSHAAAVEDESFFSMSTSSLPPQARRSSQSARSEPAKPALPRSMSLKNASLSSGLTLEPSDELSFFTDDEIADRVRSKSNSSKSAGQLPCVTRLDAYAAAHAESAFSKTSDEALLAPKFRFPHIFPPSLIELLQPSSSAGPSTNTPKGDDLPVISGPAWMKQAAEHEYCVWEMSIGQCKLAALEMYLLCTNRLTDIPEGNRQLIEDALRIATLLPKNQFLELARRLALPNHTTSTGLSNVKHLYLNYRFDLIKQRYEQILQQQSGLSDADAEFEMTWFQRHIAVLFSGIIWHVSLHSRPMLLTAKSNCTASSDIELKPNQMMLYITRVITEILQLLHVGLEQRALPSFDSLFGCFGSTFNDVTVALQETCVDGLLPYPKSLCRNMFLILLSFLVHKPESDDGGSVCDDDQFDAATLQPNWKQFLASLQCFSSAFRVGPEPQLFGLIPVFCEVLSEQLIQKRSTLLEVLESQRDPEIMEVFEAIETTIIKILSELTTPRVVTFDLAGGIRIMGTAAQVFECYLRDYHIGDPVAVARLFACLHRCLRCVRMLEVVRLALINRTDTNVTDSEPRIIEAVASRIGLTLFRSSLRQFQRVRANFFSQGLNVLEFQEFSKQICDSLSSDTLLFIPHLLKARVHPSPGEVSLLNTLSLFSRDQLALFHPKSSASVSPESFLNSVIPSLLNAYSYVDQLAPFLHQPLTSAAEQVSHGRAILHQVLPPLPALCIARLRDWVEMQTNRSKQWLPRCLQLDKWIFVDQTRHSTSVIDVCSFLSTLVSCFESFMDAGAPAILTEAAVEMLVTLVTEICKSYANSIVDSVWSEEFLLPPSTALSAVRQDDESLSSKFKRIDGQAVENFFSSVFASSSDVPQPSIGLISESMDTVAVSRCRLLQQSLDNLYVKLCDIYAVLEQVKQSASAIESKWNSLRATFNSRHEHCSQHVSNAVEFPSLALPSVPVKPVSGVFDGICGLLKESISKMQTRIARKIVWGEWRHIFLHELYMPTSTQPSSVPPPNFTVFFARSDVQRRFESTLEHAFSMLQQTAYEPLVRCVWSECVSAVTWTLLDGFGCRSFPMATAVPVTRDLEALRTYFISEFAEAQVRDLSVAFDEITALMSMSTDKLIECWQSLGIGRESDALRMRITRVLWQRWTDKPARKFIKRLLSNEIK